MDVSNILLNLLIFSMPLISLIYVFLGKMLLKQKPNCIYTASSFLMFATALYLFGYFLELNSFTYNAFLITRAIKFLGIAFIPCFGILFMTELADLPQSNRTTFSLILVSTLFWILFFTNPLHHFVYDHISFQRIQGFSVSDSNRVAGYYLLMLYFVFYLIFSTIILVKQLRTEKSISKKRGYLILLGSMQIFWLAILIVHLGFAFAGISISLILFSSFLIGFNAIKNDIFQLEVRRWNQIFSTIQEVAFLIDNHGEILSLNPVAEKFFMTGKETIKPFIRELEQAHLQKNPLKINLGADTKWFQVNKNIFDQIGRLESYLLVDFTRQYQIQEEIYQLSYHDHLTGLYNRRYFEKELSRLDTSDQLPLSLVMADINGLKLINDSFGHKQGDFLLKKAATLIKEATPENSIVARLGGDEFIIILPQTSIFEIIEVVNRLKKQVLNTEDDPNPVSISFGYETKEDPSEDIQTVFKRAEDDMYKHKLYESTSSKNKTIKLIMNTLYEKSNREMHHSERVSKLCRLIAIKMKLSDDVINQITAAGLMHDIGKIGIDEKILNKEGPLNFDEWQEIQKHPQIGYRILSSVNEFSDIAHYVFEHHEHYDGKGYPRKLKGQDISLQARIISIADAYDAMTCDRSYRKGLTKKEAIDELKRCSGTQFDPVIAKVFIEKVLNSN